MKKNAFLFFLILSLSFTAFLAGYIMIQKGSDFTPNIKTGSILDKFDGSAPENTDQNKIDVIRPIALTERKILSAVNSSNKGSVLYFEKNTGKLFELNLETKTEQSVLNKTFPNFISAVWSPTKKDLIGVFGSDQDKNFKYFNIISGKEVPLDNNIRSVSFSPDGSLIVYHYLEGNDDLSSASMPSGQTGKIVISEPDGKYQKKILDTRFEDIEISWPVREKIALQTIASEIFLVSEDGKLSNLLGPSFGLEKKWSPSGKKLLFSYKPIDPAQTDIALNFMDLESKNEYQLTIGSAEKCVWSIDDIHVFCAVPKSPSVDEIFKISTLKGTQELIAEPLMQVKELLLTPSEENLLFVNTSDELLYSIKIAD